MENQKKQEKWSEPLLIKTFGLKKFYETYPLLDEWLDAKEEFSKIEIDFMNNLRRKLMINVNTWNEEELKMNFIALLLNVLVDYESDKYNTYFEKEISVNYDGHFLKTRTDFMIAKGILNMVENPYFCFHEYKATKKNPEDPITQVLLGMLIAQKTNHDNKPLYGVYNIGREWYFMVLENQNYAVSKSFDSTQSIDLQEIVAILRKFKVILEEKLII
ncbi:hypothetical protein LV89_00159 [Arcicella aurantiaca]|uniref:Uncharacterized protein n=1 Tax=Arcicella aurantiaca TaxID=591202 RepID=A0A316F127_9BACT|nr:hypothetical protein [Arcicella aurantiaca]PWK29319.1 hypothetical protein LV89_00159 [Arcicella aurantiaca]